MAIQGENEVFTLERSESDEAWRQARTKGINNETTLMVWRVKRLDELL